MNPIFAALLEAAESLLSDAVAVVVPVLIAWFQKHVLPQQSYQAMAKPQLRDAARAWVAGLLAELGQKLLAKFPFLAFLSPLLPGLESVIADEINKGLDAIGL